MPIIKSAKKRVKVSNKAAVRNRKTKRTLRDAIKDFQAKVSSDSLSKAQSAIDIAVKKGIIHKNKAARKKKQLAAKSKASGVKTTAKSASQRTTTAKAPAKKAVAKTPAKKKPATKPKTVAKKSPAKKK